MKVLVTVGTTKFDSLIRNLEIFSSKYKKFTFIFQVATNGYKPEGENVFEYSNDFKNFISSSDLVITHAGAGSVYSLLERGKKIIVVPNLERYDKHQAEISAYLSRNDLAKVVFSLKELEHTILSIEKYTPKPYNKEPFFLIDRLINELNL